jgi:hypothetical protein
MPTKKHRHAAKAKPRAKTFNLRVRDVSQQYDALFIGLDGDAVGKVIAKASPAGQRAIERLFPNGGIAWREIDAGEWPAGLPNDWREFIFPVAGLFQHFPDHRLRRDVLGLKALDKFSPGDRFAFLMMFSTVDQGVRAAYFSETEGYFFEARSHTHRN